MNTYATPDIFPTGLAYPHAAGFKTEQPETSRQAAEATDARTLRAAVLAELRRRDNTADGIAQGLGESVLSIRPRVSELLRLGQIQDTGRRQSNISGRSAAVWRAVL